MAMSKEEKKWRAESDAHVLASAEEIRLDITRLRAALAEMERMNKVREKELNQRKELVKNSKKSLKSKKKKEG